MINSIIKLFYLFQIPVFGRSESPMLGMLYNANEEQIVSGVSLWKEENIDVVKTSRFVSQFLRYVSMFSQAKASAKTSLVVKIKDKVPKLV
jgi:hypothetical protein